LLEFKGHTGSVLRVSFSPDGKILAAVVKTLAAAGKNVTLFDVATGKEKASFKGEAPVAFSADGTRLATASSDDTTVLWDARTGQQLLEFKRHGFGFRVSVIVFSADGTRIATASEDKTAVLWDARTGQPLLEFKGHTGVVHGVAFSP